MEWPRDRVECPGNVELEHHARDLQVVDEAHDLLHKQEVVMDAAPSNERTPVRGHHASETRGKPKGEGFSKELGNEMNKADRTIVKRGLGISSLGQQGEECSLSFSKPRALRE